MGKLLASKFLEQVIHQMPEDVLANYGNCSVPESHESPGARFLNGARQGFLQILDQYNGESRQETQDKVWGVAAECPAGVISLLWEQFADLHAYREDIEMEMRSLNDMAHIALQQIAERVIQDLLNEWFDQLEAPEYY